MGNYNIIQWVTTINNNNLYTYMGNQQYHTYMTPDLETNCYVTHMWRVIANMLKIYLF